MAGLEEMWARFSLSEEEDRGAEVCGQEESIVHRLAGKFLTKRRALDAESALSLDYSQSSFWIQIHNVPNYLLSQETGESVGKTLGKVLQVVDPEDDGAGGEFLRVQINLDISRPLPRCCMLWAGQKLVGWVGIKFERLSNFCYWCGCVTYSERDCEKWLGSKGSLRKEELEYGEWMRAETIRTMRKTVAVIPGKSRR
nr:hypothetical protein CFP56_23291 [Quercus suber]